MASHRYKVGQWVRLRNLPSERADSGTYEVIRHMPETRDGELHYRVKAKLGLERAVSEAQVELAL